MTVLKTEHLTRNFGGLAAVSNVTLEIKKGELVGLIGPNGAGKTTFFNLLTGVYPPSEGSIKLSVDGELKEIGGLKPFTITNLGIGRTFQNIRLFKEQTVLENIKVAMNSQIEYKMVSSIFRLPKFYEEENEIHKKALELLEVVNLKDKKDELSKNLPYGEQRKLEIARALATNPKVLFLDEPAAGMNPYETKELTSLIKKIKDEFDITIVLIEHDMSLVMDICERIFVLEYGRLIAQGNPDEIKNNKKVIKAYLGEG